MHWPVDRERDMNKIKGFLRGLSLGLVVVIGVAAWLALPWFALLALAVLFVAWMLLTRRGRQAGSVTQVGLSTLRQRIGSSSVVVIGIAGVVADDREHGISMGAGPRTARPARRA